MLFENLKRIVDEKQQKIISTKHMSDEDLIDLVKYMVENNSVITSLTLTEGSLTSIGIDYLAKNYNRLFSLDISENNLTDDDIKGIQYLTNLKQLCIKDNCLSGHGVETLKKMNLEYLDFEGNQPLSGLHMENQPFITPLFNQSINLQKEEMQEELTIPETDQKYLEEIIKKPGALNYLEQLLNKEGYKVIIEKQKLII